jgi:hypothetical protein
VGISTMSQRGSLCLSGSVLQDRDRQIVITQQTQRTAPNACAHVRSTLCSTFVLLSASYGGPSIPTTMLGKRLIFPMKIAIDV